MLLLTGKSPAKILVCLMVRKETCFFQGRCYETLQSKLEFVWRQKYTESLIK